MLRKLFHALFFSIILLSFSPFLHAQEITSYFSPRDGCKAAIISCLSKSQQSIDVAAYELTLSDVTSYLKEASIRGIKVRLIVDPKQETGQVNQPARLKSSGVEVRSDRFEKLFHNKYAIVDSLFVITGSYNWSENAELRNAENLVVIKDAKTAADFTEDFNKHWSHSVPFIYRPERTTIQPSARAANSILPPPHFFKECNLWHALKVH